MQEIGSPRTDQKLVSEVFAIVLIIMAVAAIYASLEYRGIHNDGAYYLFRMAERENFYLYDPARTVVQALRQAPVVLMEHLGQFSLIQRAQVFSFAMTLLPLAILASCWLVLPQGRKAFLLFPLLHALIGISAASFNAVSETIIATSCFWPLLFLLLFRTRTLASQVLFLLLCVPAMYVHEAGFPLTAVLFSICILRVGRTSHRHEQLFLLAAALYLVAIFCYQLSWVIVPRIPIDRTVALRGMYTLEFLVSEGRVNLPVITGAIALAALTIMSFVQYGLRKEAATLWSRQIATVFALFAAAVIAAACLIEPTFSPKAQIAARYYALVVAFVLGIAATFVAFRGTIEWLSLRNGVVTVIISLCAAQMTSDVIGTARWHDYIADLKSRLADSSGLIAWEQMRTTGDVRRDLNWHLMSNDWVTPIVSIVLAKDGVVRSIVGLPADLGFRPVDPAMPETLPRFRGVDYRPYLEALSHRAE